MEYFGKGEICPFILLILKIRKVILCFIDEQFLCLPPIDVVFKAHVQHPVRLVQHQIFHSPQTMTKYFTINAPVLKGQTNENFNFDGISKYIIFMKK